MSNYTQDDIKDLVESCFPIIYVVCQESESIVVNYIKDCVKNLGTHVLLDWSRTEGISDVEKIANFKASQLEETRETIPALEFIMKFNKPSVTIMKHLHFDFKNGGNATVIRKLQDFVNNFTSTIDVDKDKIVVTKILIIVSPVLLIPDELRKNITIVDFNVQKFEQIKTKITNYIKDFNEEEKSSIDENKINALANASLGLSNLEIDNALSYSYLKNRTLDCKILDDLKSQIVRQNMLIEPISNLEPIENLGGFDKMKEWLLKRKAGFTVKGKEFGLLQPKGTLMIGLQGSGKTMCSKVIASIFGIPLYKVDLGKLFGQMVGQSEQRTRDVLKTLEAVAPCVVLFDEIEKGLAGLESSGKSDGGTSARVIGTVLQWLQDKEAPVFVVATSNNIAALPPELLRAGRFDSIFFVPLPNEEEREKIFEIHIRKVGRDPKGFDLKVLAKKAEEFSGAEIQQSVIESLYEAYNNKKENIDTEIILSSIEKIVPLFITAHDKLKEIYEWVGYDEKLKDGIKAKFVSEYTKDKLEKDKKRIGFII